MKVNKVINVKNLRNALKIKEAEKTEHKPI